MSKDILYPLRRLHGLLHEWTSAYTEMNAYFSASRGKTACIPGTPEHGNLGDSAIVLAQMAFLEQCGFLRENIKEIAFSQYPALRKAIIRAVDHSCLIAQMGGGNMGSQWMREENLHRQLVRDFPKNPTIIFPQTIYYSSDSQCEADRSRHVYNNRKNLTLVAREQTSYDIMRTLYPDTHVLLIPDIVLSASMNTFGAKSQKREGVLLCMRFDAERSMLDSTRHAIESAVTAVGETYRYTDMYAPCAVTKDNRTQCVRAKMEELASARLVITDRLHGMIFAAITGTPCIVFSNYNHKVKGTYKWIEYLPYIRYAESADEAQHLVSDLLALGPQVYDNTPLQPYFNELAGMVRKYAEN